MLRVLPKTHVMRCMPKIRTREASGALELGEVGVLCVHAV
jgi:hypothetical protein